MNSWTYFLHGDGGGSLVNLNTRSKTGPMYLVKSAIYLSNDPSYTVKKPTSLFPRGTNCAKWGVPTVARSFWVLCDLAFRSSSTSMYASFDLIGRINRNGSCWVAPVTSAAAARALISLAGTSGKAVESVAARRRCPATHSTQAAA